MLHEVSEYWWKTPLKLYHVVNTRLCAIIYFKQSGRPLRHTTGGSIEDQNS